MIRYLTGDRAVAHGDDRCACGRGLVRIGPIEGRVTETMHDGAGNAVGGLVFNVLFGVVGDAVKTFQIIQHKDRSITLKVVPMQGDRLPAKIEQQAREFSTKYLPGCAFQLEYVGEIPLTAAGKRKIVVIEA
jgi:phenylacetate-coenzyme A ligase PaaK-like adenylate-forming protein